MNENRIIIGLLTILVKYLVEELTHNELQIVLAGERYEKNEKEEDNGKN